MAHCISIVRSHLRGWLSSVHIRTVQSSEQEAKSLSLCVTSTSIMVSEWLQSGSAEYVSTGQRICVVYNYCIGQQNTFLQGKSVVLIKVKGRLAFLQGKGHV